MSLPVYYHRDCDLTLIRSRKVAIVGYGSQGRTHALNLRDSGVAGLTVGVREGRSADLARADGFSVMSPAEATASADVVALLTSDEAHRDLFAEQVGPNLHDGAALVVAHGLSVRFGLVRPAPSIDVVLVSPKGIGPRIREVFVEGEGVFCLFGVHQDATGRAHALGLSYAAALGCGRRGILETTLQAECESDLFGEQVVLCGGVPELVRKAFDTLVEAGYPPEVAWFECFYELKLVVDLMFERGVDGAFEKISNTAEYGAYLTGPRVVGDEARRVMADVLADVRSGRFVQQLMADFDAGSPDLKRLRGEAADSPLDVAGRLLRRPAP